MCANRNLLNLTAGAPIRGLPQLIMPPVFLSRIKKHKRLVSRVER
jgi:hypothetical protein